MPTREPGNCGDIFSLTHRQITLPDRSLSPDESDISDFFLDMDIDSKDP